MWWVNSNNAAGDNTIDLHNLNSIELRADRFSVSVGSATTWDADYETLDPKDLSVAGGRVAGVGIAKTTGSPAMIRAAYEAFKASIPLVQHVAGLWWVVNMEPLPPQLYTHDDLDDNALNLTRKKETLVVFLVSPSWTDPAQDEVVYKAAQSIIADVDARTKALGAYDSDIYLNHAGRGSK